MLRASPVESVCREFEAARAQIFWCIMCLCSDKMPGMDKLPGCNDWLANMLPSLPLAFCWHCEIWCRGAGDRVGELRATPTSPMEGGKRA